MLLDLFLASLMRDGSDLSRRLRAADVSRQRLHEIKQQAKEAGFLSGRCVPEGELVAFFGPPTEAGDDSLRYELELWPDHYYQFGVNESGGVFHHGFVLKIPAADLPASLPMNPEAVQASFRVGFHTFAEVERVMGLPRETRGWGPMEEWFYGPVPDPGERYLVFEFDLGLLADLTHRPFDVVLEAESRSSAL